MSDDFSNGSMKLFHPRGPQVTLPVLFDGDYRHSFAAVGAALDAGFLAEAPGLEQRRRTDESAGCCATDSKEMASYARDLLYSVNEHFLAHPQGLPEQARGHRGLRIRQQAAAHSFPLRRQRPAAAGRRRKRPTISSSRFRKRSGGVQGNQRYDDTEAAVVAR